jgi:hypothetical protein
MAACTTRVAQAWLTAITTLAALLPAAAGAVEGCHGTYNAGVYSTLPSPMVVGIDQSHSSPTDPAVMKAFNNGLSQSGIGTGGGANVVLQLHYSVFNQGGPGPNTAMGAMSQSMSGGSGWMAAPTPQTGSDFGGGQSNAGLSGLGGGPEFQMPGLPKIGTFSFKEPPPQPPVLIIRVSAKTPGSPQAAWTAMLQCKVTTTDSEDLAYQLGQFIGSIIGQRVSNSPM